MRVYLVTALRRGNAAWTFCVPRDAERPPGIPTPEHWNEEKEFDFFCCEPDDEVFSKKSDAQIYALENKKDCIALCFVRGGKATINISKYSSTKANIKWLNSADAVCQNAYENIGEQVTFEAPDSSLWICLLIPE